jgi:hypothetical protein
MEDSKAAFQFTGTTDGSSINGQPVLAIIPFCLALSQTLSLRDTKRLVTFHGSLKLRKKSVFCAGSKIPADWHGRCLLLLS